eukprot:CAMPEP_0181226976 /NCGR_PEP_ID=MMETSP1096-20121128/32541_1 /TAXON_ID=156174 ORGANISM="Chrysochromulina ericina, Strain CCMP281" /NCGR_SAMPLE_ID=MMETSP1096 /ASSEMBLY_ACC=CAM_ASM_000453 /LENGTH=354 /DNA_ID=CAMNT_0023320349 /DNA_START=44 /DNA_END=1108 /DNA_ORIENTATION=-
MTKLQVGRFQLEEGAQLGAGGYGVVVKALDTQSGSIVAAKKIDKRKMKGDAIEREVMLMRMLNHPNVIAVLDQVEMDTTIFIFMELATKGELFGRVIQSGSLTEADARPYFTQLMNAVKFMHDKGVAHRDLKLENVLISASPSGDDICKVCDFGLAYRYEVDGSGKVLKGRPLTETCGSKSYAAPEVLEGRGYDGFDADVWSCGICLFAMLAGFFPLDEATGADWRFERVKLATQHRQSATRTIFSFYDRPCQLSSQVVDMIDGMILVQPNRRLKTEDVLQSMWVIDDTIKADYADEYMYDEAPRYRGQAGSFDPNAVSGYGGQQDMAPLYRGAPAGVIAAPPPLMKQLAVLGQ